MPSGRKLEASREGSKFTANQFRVYVPVAHPARQQPIQSRLPTSFQVLRDVGVPQASDAQETSTALYGGWEWKSAAYRDKTQECNVSKKKWNLSELN